MRPRRALLAAVSLALLLTACGGGDATQGSVRDDVKSALLRREGNDLSDEEAGAVADCVSRAMFESGDFSKEERNDATRAVDGDDPDPDLVVKVEALVDGCLDDSSPSDDTGTSETTETTDDAESTTTTDDDAESTTTTEDQSGADE